MYIFEGCAALVPSEVSAGSFTKEQNDDCGFEDLKFRHFSIKVVQQSQACKKQYSVQYVLLNLYNMHP